MKWQSKQQSIVTLSIMEAEFINMSTAGRDMVWIRQLLCDIKIPILMVPWCWIRSVANEGIVITIVTLESWGGLV